MPNTKRGFAVLIIEDNLTDQKTMSKMLAADERFDITFCDTLEDANRDLGERPYDCVLVDWKLPDGSGEDLLSHVVQYYPWLAAIVVSGNEEAARSAIAAGAQDFLHKGNFDEAMLMHAIEFAVERKRNERTYITHSEPAHVQAHAEIIQSQLDELFSSLIYTTRAIRQRITSSVDLTGEVHTSPEEMKYLANLLGQNEEQLIQAHTMLEELSDKDTQQSKVYEPLTGERLVLRVLSSLGLQRLDKIALAVRVEKNLPTLQGDPVQLVQVLRALLLNAVEAIESGNKHALDIIRVTIKRHGDKVRVVIEDSGPGIPRLFAHKIFSPFFSLKNPRQAGMGLTIARELVTRNGGELMLMPEQSNAGAKFVLSLAIASEPDPRDNTGRHPHIRLLAQTTSRVPIKTYLTHPDILKVIITQQNDVTLGYLDKEGATEGILYHGQIEPEHFTQFLTALEFFSPQLLSRVIAENVPDMDEATQLMLVQSLGLYLMADAGEKGVKRAIKHWLDRSTSRMTSMGFDPQQFNDLD